MALLPIITAPDPRLKKVCASVAAVDDEVRRLMDDMLETMYSAPGIGLAAPQVGVLKRVIVIDTAGEDEEKTPLFLANPERSEEHTSELQSLMRISYDVFCLKKTTHTQ